MKKQLLLIMLAGLFINSYAMKKTNVLTYSLEKSDEEAKKEIANINTNIEIATPTAKSVDKRSYMITKAFLDSIYKKFINILDDIEGLLDSNNKGQYTEAINNLDFPKVFENLKRIDYIIGYYKQYTKMVEFNQSFEDYTKNNPLEDHKIAVLNSNDDKYMHIKECLDQNTGKLNCTTADVDDLTNDFGNISFDFGNISLDNIASNDVNLDSNLDNDLETLNANPAINTIAEIDTQTEALINELLNQNPENRKAILLILQQKTNLKLNEIKHE